MIFNGERLRNARKYKGLTLDEVVSLMQEKHGVKSQKGIISRWENGKAVPRDESKKALADILEVPLDYLLGRKSYEYTIIELRHQNKMSIEELSKKSGVSSDAIYLTEQELDDLNKDELQNVGKVFGFDDFHSWLLENDIHVYPKESVNLKELTELLKQDDVTYNNHVLDAQDRKRILTMLSTLFPNY